MTTIPGSARFQRARRLEIHRARKMRTIPGDLDTACARKMRAVPGKQEEEFFICKPNG